MKVIYIRHGEDTRDGYKYDERLTRYGKKSVKKITIELIEEHGFPDIIHYSPYYRTRQTKRLMLKVINETLNKELPITNCDFRLSRFFTKSQRKTPDIRRDTRKRGAPIKESWKGFKRRIAEHLSEIGDDDNNDYKVIWCVTHTLVLDYIINNHDIEHEYKIPYLDTVVLDIK